MEIREGQIVEFLEGGRFICAVVLGVKGSRLHLVTHLGRETNLTKSRLIHCSPERIEISPRQEAIEVLLRKNELRDAVKKEVDMEEIWELLEGEDKVWSPREFSETIFGEDSTPDHEAGVIRAVISDRIYFKFRDGLIRALSREDVERLLEQRRKEEERIRRLEEGGRLLASLWGQGRAEAGIRTESVADTPYWIEAIREYCLFGDEAKRAGEVRDLFRKEGLHAPSAPFETLVRAGVWSEDENIELLRVGIERGFSEEVLQEAREIEQNYRKIILEDSTRMDMRHLDCFTMDAEESRDLDDALSLRQIGDDFEVGIHITDVGSFIRPGMALFHDAVDRATSLYLPDEIITMLPESLCNGTFSLLPQEDRAALSFFVILDREGAILDSRVERTIICSREKMGYGRCDELIEKEQGTLKILFDLALALQRRRIEHGNALPLPIPELNIRVENGQIRVWLDESGPSRFLVSELMILANWVGARTLRDNMLPALYRSQPEPRERIIDGGDTDLRSNYRQRRLISRGVLGPDPDFHSGLGLDCYTTLTSPMRRGLDLLMQAQLLEFLHSGRPLFSKDDLEKLSITLQDGLIRAASVRNARSRYWLLKHLSSRMGEDFKAWVLDILDTKLLLVLKDYLLTVEVPKEHKMDYHLDQEVFIRIKRINPRENHLKFEWGGLA